MRHHENKNPRNGVDFCDIHEVAVHLMRQQKRLDVEQEVHNVAIFYDVVLAF